MCCVKAPVGTEQPLGQQALALGRTHTQNVPLQQIGNLLLWTFHERPFGISKGMVQKVLKSVKRFSISPALFRHFRISS